MGGPEDGILKGKVGGKTPDQIRREEEIKHRQLYGDKPELKGASLSDRESADKAEPRIKAGQVFISPNGHRYRVISDSQGNDPEESISVSRLDNEKVRMSFKAAELLGERPRERQGGEPGFWTRGEGGKE